MHIRDKSHNWMRDDCVKQQAKIQTKAKQVLRFSWFFVFFFCLFKMAERSLRGLNKNFSTRSSVQFWPLLWVCVILEIAAHSCAAVRLL